MASIIDRKGIEQIISGLLAPLGLTPTRCDFNWDMLHDMGFAYIAFTKNDLKLVYLNIPMELNSGECKHKGIKKYIADNLKRVLEGYLSFMPREDRLARLALLKTD